MNYLIYSLMLAFTLSGFSYVNAGFFDRVVSNTLTTTYPDGTEVVYDLLKENEQCTNGSCSRPVAKTVKNIVKTPVRVTKNIIQNKPVRKAVIGTRLPTRVCCECNCCN